MKRIDKIYCYLNENTQRLSKDELLKNKGFDAISISEDLGVLRNNVSKELNELLKLDKILKVRGRPVKYLDKAGAEKILGIQLKQKFIEVDSIQELIPTAGDEDPFKFLIGAEKSLKNQVEQAKAAIMYPPGGLHTLIFGQTGVGKSLFAKMMHNYGKYIKKFTDEAPFIVFNCADYYNNPQLLLAHIFGYVKGAFTGADKEKEGLVERADGGILFLDEIHRLPPEGQEMIFYFMDTGTYNKLGETERKRKANVLIIGATTEDHNSSMLKTFLRRIPIIINIPSLQERTIEEKLDIIRYLFANEVRRVNKPLRIASEVIQALIGSVSYGNVGQLKSNIQLTCAKGFLDSINYNRQYIELNFKTLPGNIRDGLFEFGRNAEFANILDDCLVISPDGYKSFFEDSNELPFNLYSLIEDKISILKEEGVDDNDIKKFIIADVNTRIKKFYNRFNKDGKNREHILKVVDKAVLELAEEAKILAEESLNKKYSDRFIYALGFHLSAFLKRIKEKNYVNQVYIDNSIQVDAKELEVAVRIKSLISQTFQVNVPEAEVAYIAILLKSVEEEKQEQVGLIVAAHGTSTASSMVNVVQNLLGDVPVCAIDMPLDVSPKEVLAEIIEKVKIIDKGKGVLLLVDMGSLSNIEATIAARTGVKIKSIDMVSTPLVLEAARKVSIFDMNLEDIYNSIRKFRGYNKDIKVSPGEKIIVTVCSSGKGTAIKLKKFVEEIIFKITEEPINIIPVEIRELDNKIQRLQKQHKILAVIGMKKPKENIPFVPLEKLINGMGERILRNIMIGNEFAILPSEANIVVRDVCEDNLKQFLTYLNPSKIIGLLLDFISKLEEELKVEFDNTMKIKVITHVGYALERMVVNDGLICGADKNPISWQVAYAVDRACEVFQRTLNIVLTDDEKYYICEMLN